MPILGNLHTLNHDAYLILSFNQKIKTFIKSYYVPGVVLGGVGDIV